MAAPSPPFKRLYENLMYPDSGCWEWQGQLGSSGYGHIKAFGKLVGVHRLSYELYKGPIADGMEVMHSCDNRRCVNPDHLSLGTHAENMKEMIDRGRRIQGSPNPRRGIRNKQSKPVLVLGKPYGSLKEAEAAIGCGSGSVAYWIKNKPGKARLLSCKEYEEMKNVISQ